MKGLEVRSTREDTTENIKSVSSQPFLLWGSKCEALAEIPLKIRHNYFGNPPIRE